jgi:hypothetical protein
VCSHYLHRPYASNLIGLSALDTDTRQKVTNRGVLASQSRGWGSWFQHPNLHHRDPPRTDCVLFVLQSQPFVSSRARTTYLSWRA